MGLALLLHYTLIWKDLLGANTLAYPYTLYVCDNQRSFIKRKPGVGATTGESKFLKFFLKVILYKDKQSSLFCSSIIDYEKAV